MTSDDLALAVAVVPINRMSEFVASLDKPVFFPKKKGEKATIKRRGDLIQRLYITGQVPRPGADVESEHQLAQMVRVRNDKMVTCEGKRFGHSQNCHHFFTSIH